MYTLYSGVTYTQGETNLEEVKGETVSDIALAIAKIMEDEKDAVSFTFTISVKAEE